MNFVKISVPENKILKIAKKIKDSTKTRGILLRFDQKNRILVCFPEDTPKMKIEELKVILKSEFPEENFLFRTYRKTIS